MSEFDDGDPMHFSDDEAEWEARQKPRKANGSDDMSTSRFKPTRFRDVKLGADRPYLVKGLIPREGLVVVWGSPKCGKTFWTFDVAMHIAMGWGYRGRRVSPGAVVYIACEGERGLAARKEAYRIKWLADDDDPPFYVLTTRLDLVADAAQLIADIQAAISENPVVAVVIDTLNRSIAGSESRDEDMSAYVKAADTIRETFKAAVVIIHHCGVEGTRPRGHTSLTGACDAQIAVERDPQGNIACTVEYMKDGPEGDEIASRLVTVAVGKDEDGEDISSCVVESQTIEEPKKRGKKLSQTEQKVLDFLHETVNTVGACPPKKARPMANGGSLAYDIPDGVLCVPVSVWRDACVRGLITKADTPPSKRMAFTRAVRTLTDKGRHARIFDGWAWPTNGKNRGP